MPQPDQPPVHDRVIAWYDANARELPWRGADATPWAVLVSEFMLQQTPVARVLPVFEQWMATWPTPDDLAAAGSGEAVRAWGRLGYPRRAQRLHAAATAIVADHGGRVPDSYEDLLALPGVGDYTAAAVATFAYGRRHVVLDTNVRRVLVRMLAGEEFPSGSVTRAERELAARMVPEDEPTAATWSVAVMELGALVCSSANPRCVACPVADLCSWRRSGYPPYDGPPRRGQTYAGTDRQCRGRILAVLRDAHEPVHASRIESAWAAAEQRDRCLRSLLEDGLVTEVAPAVYTL